MTLPRSSRQEKGKWTENKRFAVLAVSMLVLIPPDSYSQCQHRFSGMDAAVEQRVSRDGYIAPPSRLLNGTKPEAHWIWDSGEINPRNYYLHLRKNFSLSQWPARATAYISAHAFAELYINGIYVDRVPTNPDPEYQTYEEIDLGPYLRKGSNCIAALVYNPGAGLHHRMDARGGFFFQSHIYGKPGEVTKILSDRSWRVTQAHAWDTSTVFRQRDFTIGMRERYDARLAYEGWEQTSYDDSNWELAKEIGIPPCPPWNQIVVVHRERLQYETLKPVAVWDVKGWSVFDFGRGISAFPQFTVTADREGAELTLGTGERLDPDSLPAMKDNVDFTETYLTKKGRQSWHPLTWRGFRYLSIKRDSSISIDDVSAQFRSFPVRRDGSFTCSDGLLNTIWETGRWTLQICGHDTWMDTPWREQTQYIAGDARYNTRYSAYAFAPNIKLLADYNILSGAYSQRYSSEGAIRSRYPTGAHLGPATSTYIPDYQLEWILMLREHHLFYNDDELIKQVYPNLKKLLRYFEGYLSVDRGLLGRVPGWVVLDHPDTYVMDVDGENTAMNCLYYGALNAASWIARNIMDDDLQAAEWEKQAQGIQSSILRYLWSEEDNAFRDGFQSSRITQQTHVYALKYGLVPEEHKAGVVEFMKNQGRSCEQSFSYWLLYAMFSEGEGPWALNYIRQNWGAQLAEEGFNGSWHEMWHSPPGMSRSHSWSSGPTALLPEKVLGVEPILPGWQQFRIRPDLCDLEWAMGDVPTVAGNIHVKLKRLMNDEDMQIDAVVPEKTTSIIHIPVLSPGGSAIYVNDQKIWEDGEVLAKNEKITFEKRSDDSVLFRFQPGIYVITAVAEDNSP